MVKKSLIIGHDNSVLDTENKEGRDYNTVCVVLVYHEYTKCSFL